MDKEKFAELQEAVDRLREMEMEKEKKKFAELQEAVEQVELVDAHAHNIVGLDSKRPFESCFTQAEGDALPDTIHTLSFKRNLRDIAKLYKLPPNSSLLGVEEYRRSQRLEDITKTCFERARISAILIDYGIKLDKMQDIEWHKSFAPVGGILRIERLAEEILDEDKQEGFSWTLNTFTETFEEKLKSAANDIVGLKSIAAYRSGLKINTKVTDEDAEKGLAKVLDASKPEKPGEPRKSVCITNKSFIDYIFKLSLEVVLRNNFGLPMQIHTGFGDKDLDLRLSNPLHLRTLLDDERFSKSRIVLLHASYPFSKEASYLASVYPQVYLDFGLAIPMLSVHGMISSVKELLELAPIKKVMFSTDGCAFPETYFLGAKKAREVVFSVLHDACIAGDLSIPEAVEAAKDIFARNATKFYNIRVVKSFALEKNASPTSELEHRD